MFTAQACPDRESYRQLLAGPYPSEDQVEQLAAHLEDCPHCAETVRGLLNRADTFPEGVARACLPPAIGEEDVVARLMERLRHFTFSRTAGDIVSTEIIGPPADDLSALLTPPQALGELGRLGQYRVLKVIGQGGMGVVLEAEDTRLQRAVALKVMKPALTASAKARERFSAEARAIAAVQHDHITPVYHVGEERGVPFLAMPLLRGEPLEARLRREGKLPPAEAVGIAREVALGLAAAHARGLIHRDVKPANVWLEPVAAGPGEETTCRVKLLDFGLARAVQGDARLTQSGALVGTPAYMAPEQARGEAVDGRADLFSLGCVLYQMLTGRPPFRGKDVMSTLLAVTSEQPLPPRQVNPEVSPELNNLVLRLLAKNLPDRPASAQAVALELAALQAGPAQADAPRPCAAPALAPRRPGRRWWLPAAVAAGLLLLAGGGLLLQPIIIRIFNKDGKEVGRLEVPAGGSAQVEQPGQPPVRVPAPGAPPKEGTAPKALPELAKTPPLSPLALVVRPAKLDGVRSWTIETVPPRGQMWAVQLSPDGKFLAAGGDDGTVRLWDTTTGRLARALITGQGIGFLAWLPDSKTLAVGGEARVVALWDTAAGRLVRKIGTDVGFPSVHEHTVALSPDGRTLAVVMGQRIELWETASGKRLRASPELKSWVAALAWSPDGATLALGLGSGDVALWPVAEQKVQTLPRLKKDGPLPAMEAVAWSSDGKTLAAGGGGYKSEIGIWDVASRKLLRPLDKQTTTDALRGLQWIADDQTLQLICACHIRHIDSNTGKVTRTGQTLTLTGYVLGAGGSRDDAIRWWMAHSRALYWGGGRKETHHGINTLYPPRGMTWSRSGERLVSLGGRFTLWLPAQGTMVRGYEHTSSGGWGAHAVVAAFSGDEKWLATGSEREGFLWVYDTRNGQQVAQQQAHQGSCRAVAWSPDGKWIATAGDDKVVRTWAAAESFRPVRRFEGHEKSVTTVAWSPDSKTLASGGGDGTVRLWNVSTGKHRILKTGSQWWGNSVAWSPDGKALAVAGADRHAQVWSAESGEPLPCQAMFSHDDGNLVGWSADGTTLVCTGGWGATSRLYDVKTWEVQKEVAVSSFSPDLSLYFAPDGYRLCETKTGRCVGSLVPLHGGTGVAISADGHYRGAIKDPEKQMVQIAYVIQTDKGQETLTPEEFSKRYHWKNDPSKVRLSPP